MTRDGTYTEADMLRATEAAVRAGQGEAMTPMERVEAAGNVLLWPVPEVPSGVEGVYALHRTREGLRDAVSICMGALTLLPEDSYDTLYVTGQSGIVPGSVCAFLLNKRLAILRKVRERAHGNMVERDSLIVEPRCVIIDDFICYGRTMARLLHRCPGPLVGVVLYGQVISHWERCNGYVQPSGLFRRKVQLRRVRETPLFNLEVTK